MRNFEHKIKQLQFRQNLIIGLKFALIALAVFMIAFTLFFVLFHSAANHVQELFLFALAIKISLFLIFIFLALQANRAMKNKLQIAKQLDEFNQDKTDTYQNAYELKKELPESEILEKILQKADVKAHDQIVKINIKREIPLLLMVLFISIFSSFMFTLNSNEFIQAYTFLKLTELPEVKHKKTVEVIPGNVSLTRNSRLKIEVIDPEQDVSHKFFYKIDKSWREESLIGYKKVFNKLDFSFSYFVRTPFATSDTFRVEVYELPVVTNIDVRYDYPAYTKLKSEFEQNASGNIRAVQGTKITLKIAANNPIETGKIIFSTGDLNDLDRTGKSSFKTDFKVEQNGSYHFNLEDILGNTSRKLSKSITVIYDKIPEIKITAPGKDTLLTQNMLLPLSIFASDDFGLTTLTLHYQINRSVKISKKILENISHNSLTHDHVLDLNNNIMIPGDKVIYWVEVFDNSPKKQSALSPKFTARFPSIEEIYKEIEEKEKEKSRILENTLKKSEELQKEFEDKRREMIKKDDFNWEDKKEIENFIKEQSNLNEAVDKVAEDFNELMRKFESNNALAPETIEKMKKIQELIDEISNDELREAMQKLQQKMDQIDSEDIKKAMQDFQFSMEDFAEKLEQTIKLLEDIKKEQSIEKALQISEEMEEMQNKLNEKTNKNEESNEKLADQQKQISEKLDTLKEQLEKASELMDKKEDSDILEQLQQMQEMIEQDSLASDLDESAKNLQQNKKQEASTNQQQASKKMKKMRLQLENMQEMMSSGMMMDIAEILDKTINRLLIFSQYHEQTANKFNNDPFQILETEISIFESIDLTIKELYEVPMIILAIGSKFMYDANMTFSSFRELFQYINDAKTAEVQNLLEDIQKGINLMIYDLMQASNNMQQGGGGGGMQSMMQSLQQMGQQQMMMNMMTQQMMLQLSENGKMTNEMRSNARKLAGDEQRLAENLKRMLQSNQEAQKQTSAINKIIEDLESIAHDLKYGRIDNELIQKQERILSRLLDAQRSIHKREFSKKRKAETSEIENWDLPEEIKLKFDKLRKKALLQEEYEELPKEYKELIQEYLRLLNEKYEDE